MGLRRAFFLAAATSLLVAHPAAANAASAQENLDCVIWASYRAGNAQGQEDTNAFVLATAWFVGLYEGQTGKAVDEPMIARANGLSVAQIGPLEGPCLARFSSFADRMSEVGNRLGASES